MRRSRGRLVEALIVVMPEDDAALDPGVARVGAPTQVAKALVEPDRGALRIAQVEIEHDEAEFAAQPLDLRDDPPGDAAAARPGRDKGGRDGAGEGLRLVVARRPRQLHRAGDDPVEPADHQPPLRHQQHAFPIILQYLARRHLEPAKAAAFLDRALGRLAQIVEIGAGILRQVLDRDLAGRPGYASLAAHGRHARKLAISRSPAIWLFSGWNCVPTRLSRPTRAAMGPP